MLVNDDNPSIVDEIDENEADMERPLVGRTEGSVSTNRTLMNFLRGMIGAGCLALPVAFKQAGLWMGFVLVFILGLINLHCMMMLVHCAQDLCQKSGKLELDYGHLAKKAVDYGIVIWRPHSRKALYFVNTIIAMLQIGIGSVLFVFMAAHIKEVVEHYDHKFEMNVNIYMLLLLLPVILMNMVRTLKLLAIFSFFGNVLMILAFIIIFQNLVRPPNKASDLPAITNFNDIAVACGSILYAFEGQAMVLPMENKMRHPEDMVGATGVLSTGTMIVTIVYAATGFFGFVTYGEDVEGSITLNLPNTLVYDGVKLLLVLVMYLGYVIQMYIVVEMLWPAIRRKLLGGYESFHLFLEYIFRAVLVCLTLLIAFLVPKLELIIPLVGVSAGMLLAFVLPPIIETITFLTKWQSSGRKVLICKLAKNIALVILGVVGLIIGIVSTVQNIIEHKDD